MICVNDFKGLTDNDVIEKALSNRTADGIVVIPPRISDIEPQRRMWLLDRAILIPEDTTVILQNCTIKLSDSCRDNFFRSANCGFGIENPPRLRNIHIRGEGLSALVGADHPRATGDGGKILACPCPYTPEDICRMAPWVPEERRSPEKLDFDLDSHSHSYGTDAGKEGESQYGDWRGVGILLANVEDFSIENLRIVKSHGWGISLEACADGRVEKISFDANMSKEIDGMLNNMENQDGIDIRNGCHHIIISDITGNTGDDVIALTAIVSDKWSYKPGGSLRTTHVMHNDWSRRDRDIHDVIIRNVIAWSQLCHTILLLPANSRIWNVVIDGIIDNPPPGQTHQAVLKFGSFGYGSNLPGSLSNITVSNVICNCSLPIRVDGYLKDSVITNVVNSNPDTPVVRVRRKGGLDNVQISNIATAGKTIIE